MSFGCRLHGRSCRTPWGYDLAHTDQRHPYTLDQLADRDHGPHRYAYPDHDAYLRGWYLWRSLQRDAELNPDERDASDTVRLTPLLEQLGYNGMTASEALTRHRQKHGTS